MAEQARLLEDVFITPELPDIARLPRNYQQ
jgi:hypothetical protein